MRTFLFVFICSLSFCTVALPQHIAHQKDVKDQLAPYRPGMGSHHDPVSTTNADAQKFFDQGPQLCLCV